MSDLINNINNLKYDDSDMLLLFNNYSISKIVESINIKLDIKYLYNCCQILDSIRHLDLTNDFIKKFYYIFDMEFKSFYNDYIKKCKYINTSFLFDSLNYRINILNEENKNMLINLLIKYLNLDDYNKNYYYAIDYFELLIQLKGLIEINKFIFIENKQFIKHYIMYICNCIAKNKFNKLNINKILNFLNYYYIYSREINIEPYEIITDVIINIKEIDNISLDYKNVISYFYFELKNNNKINYLINKIKKKDEYLYLNFLNLFKIIFDEKMEKKYLRKLLNNGLNHPDLHKFISSRYIPRYKNNEVYLTALTLCEKLTK